MREETLMSGQAIADKIYDEPITFVLNGNVRFVRCQFPKGVFFRQNGEGLLSLTTVRFIECDVWLSGPLNVLRACSDAYIHLEIIGSRDYAKIKKEDPPEMAPNFSVDENPTDTGDRIEFQDMEPEIPDDSIEEEYDEVNHPSHYNWHPAGIECIDVSEHFPANLAQAIQYIWRCGYKPGVDAQKDLDKAIWFLQREKQRLEKYGEGR